MSNYFLVRTDIFNYAYNKNTLMLFLVLSKFANADGECFPSRKTICDIAGFEISTYKKHINKLIKMRMIKRDKRYRECGGQTSNLYRIVAEDPTEFKITADILDSGLSINAICVYTWLCKYAAYYENEYYPDTAVIAEECGIKTSEVISAIKEIKTNNIEKIDIDQLPKNKQNQMLYAGIFAVENSDEQIDENYMDDEMAYFWVSDEIDEDYIYMPKYIENADKVCQGCIDCDRCIFKCMDDEYLCVKNE